MGREGPSGRTRTRTWKVTDGNVQAMAEEKVHESSGPRPRVGKLQIEVELLTFWHIHFKENTFDNHELYTILGPVT